jgi:hypothetical protein
VNILKRLTCKHENAKLIETSEWFPTFKTTNGIEDEDERVLVFKCPKCKGTYKRVQVKSNTLGRALTQKHIPIDDNVVAQLSSEDLGDKWSQERINAYKAYADNDRKALKQGEIRLIRCRAEAKQAEEIIKAREQSLKDTLKALESQGVSYAE